MTIIRVISKFSKILSKHQKTRIFELTIMMVIGGFLEMLSVSLMLPFINAVMAPEDMMSNKYVIWISDIFELNSYTSFLVFAALILAGAYIVKNVFLVFQLGVQYRFVYNNLFFVQARLLRNYLSRPYEHFLNINTGEVLRIIGTDTGETFALLTSLLSLFSEIIVSIVLVSTIFVLAPTMTLGMSAMLIVMVIVILVVIRPILRREGYTLQKSCAQMNQWLMQSIHGIKELKIMRSEEFFAKNFEKYGIEGARSRFQSNTLAIIPRFLIEAISLSSFFIMVAVMIYNGAELNTLIPMLSVVAMAAIRLLPSANRIAQAMADIAYREPMLDKMIENIEDTGELVDADMHNTSIPDKTGLSSAGVKTIAGFSYSVAMSDVSYKYPTGDRYILKNASMSIKKGESVGIVGVSGAGKTTAIDILIGLLHPQSGGIFVDSVDITSDLSGWLSNVGYIPQSIFLLDGNIRENVAFGVPLAQIDDDKIWMALKEAALDEYVKSLPDRLDTEIGERGIRLSGGQRQRIGIARAIYFDPALLVFDEATSALDHETEAAIMESINGLHRKKTMLIIAHRLTTIKNCDHIYRVENQKIVKEK